MILAFTCYFFEPVVLKDVFADQRKVFLPAKWQHHSTV